MSGPTTERNDEFVGAMRDCWTNAAQTVTAGRPVSPTLVLDLGDREVVRFPLDSGLADSLFGSVRAIRASLPGSRPVEVAMVLNLLTRPAGSDVRPSEDPRRRTALVIYSQVPKGAYKCVAGEYWIGDDGAVTWAEDHIEGDTWGSSRRSSMCSTTGCWG